MRRKRPGSIIFERIIILDDDSPMELNSQGLQCFLAVAEHESYTRAAAALSLSQPGVHQHVRKLEARLHTKLVEQLGKRVVLTEHGRVVYQYARRSKDEETDLIRYLRDDDSLDQGQLRLAAGTTAAEFIIPTIAVRFQLEHPGIQIRVRATGTNDEVDNGVLDRSFDLGIHSDATPTPGVDKTPFLADTLVGIAPVEHRLANSQRPVTPLDIAREPFIHFGPHDANRTRRAPIQSLISEWFSAAGVEPTSRLTVGALGGIKRAVRDGAGIAIVSRYSVDPGEGGIATFQLAAAPQRNFVLISRDRGWESHVVRAFREYVVSLCWAEGDARQFIPAITPKRKAHARTL